MSEEKKIVKFREYPTSDMTFLAHNLVQNCTVEQLNELMLKIQEFAQKKHNGGETK